MQIKLYAYHISLELIPIFDSIIPCLEVKLQGSENCAVFIQYLLSAYGQEH
jgi:hypothetical protein